MKSRTNKLSRNDGEDKASSAGWMKTGSDINKVSDQLAAENERKAEQRKRTGGIDPNRTRFYMKPGNECEVVILDEEVDTVAFFEHSLKKDGKWGNFESCPGEWSNCPLCSSGDHKAFVWFLTILDCTGYDKDDGTHVPYQRRLLPIKPSQANTYKRILRAAYKEHGTIRGVVLTLERDTGDKSAAIGEPVIRDSSRMYDFMDEDELVEEFGHAAIKSSKSGDVLVKKNGLLQPFDYAIIFPKPDAKDIAKRWGLGSSAGSDEEYEEETGSSKKKSSKRVVDDDDDDDDVPARKKATKTATKTAKRVVEEEPEEEEEEEEENPLLAIAQVADRKGASRNRTLDAAAEELDLDPDDYDSWLELAEAIIELQSKPKTPAKKVAKKKAKVLVEDDDDEEEADEEEEEAPKKRTLTRRSVTKDEPKPKAKSKSRRMLVDDDDEDDEIPFR